MKTVNVPCPKCGATASVQPAFVSAYSDPHFFCKKCKYEGKISWHKDTKDK